jgi:RimJ/RimL family protein N-acetyltransferase
MRPQFSISRMTERDLDEFRPPCQREDEAQDLIDRWRQVLAQGRDTSHAIASRVDGRLVGIGGVIVFDRSLGWAMFVPAGDTSLTDWRVGLRPLRDWLNCLQYAHGIRRLEANIEATFDKAIITALALGFEYSGDRTGWDGTDQPVMVYARLRPRPPETAWQRECRRELHLATLMEHCPAAVARVRRWS